MGFLDRLLSDNQTPSGDPPGLRRQIERAMNGLSLATAAHDATWHLGEADWDLDQDVGTIVFTTPQGIWAQAPVQIIGTFNTEDGTWLWGWDHPSVVPALAVDAKKCSRTGSKTALHG